LAQRKISCVQLAKIPAPDFDLAMTLGSGQVFHWEKAGDGFIGAIGDRPVYVQQDGDLLKVYDGEAPSSAREARALPGIVANYFALDHPLTEICASFPADPVMSAAQEFCRGLRIIRQPKWECLAMFICSSMKQVAHIRQISRNLRERFGEAQKIDPPPLRLRRGEAVTVFTFPAADRIAQSSEKELRKCALGYRARTLLATARLVASGDVDLEKLTTFTDVDLRTGLCELPGVGAKVANCVMLFAYERLRAFPIDVWIERVLRESYFPRARKLNAARLRAFTEGYFGDHGGYAQQYLFHHARTNKTKTKIKRKRKSRGFVTISGVR
jgi:N-glycosylase/DNA lyase